MTAQSDEDAVPRWPASSQNPYRFEPTRQTTSLLGRTLPPSAPRCHENERPKGWISPSDFRDNVQSSCCSPLYMDYERRLRARSSHLSQPRTLRARYLQHRRSEWLEEIGGIY